MLNVGNCLVRRRFQLFALFLAIYKIQEDRTWPIPKIKQGQRKMGLLAQEVALTEKKPSDCLGYEEKATPVEKKTRKQAVDIHLMEN